MAAWSHVVVCPECEGAGLVCDRHPNDPSARSVSCEACGGTGFVPCGDFGCLVCFPEEQQ